MRKFTVELTESELKVVASALRYTKAYKGAEVYETVLNRLVDRIKGGVPKYYVVQGTLDDGICKCTKTMMVKAKNSKQAVEIALMYVSGDAGVISQLECLGEASKNYELCGVLKA